MMVTRILRVRSWRLGALLAVAAGLGLLATAGCPASPPPPAKESRMLVGKVDGTEALIGLLADETGIVAYVCDGVEGPISISGWYEGAVQEGAFELAQIGGTSYEGTGADRRVTGMVAGDALEGEYVLDDGTKHSWRAVPADANTAGGLYVSNVEGLLASVVVTNEGEGRGLSRSIETGWTTAVTLPPELTTGDRLDVTVALQPLSVAVIRNLTDLTGLVRGTLDPLPTVGNGTLMVMAVVADNKVVGHAYAEARLDRIGLPTINRTKLLRSNPPAKVLQATMRVRVLDSKGGVLAGLFINDPLSSRIEVPGSFRGENPFWTDLRRDVPSFLVAVPNIRGARRLVFTRFNDKDQEIDAGQIDLQAATIGGQKNKGIRLLQAAQYNASNAEHATVVLNGPSEERVDLLILAEGFQDTNADRLAFSQAVQNLLSFVWSTPIYGEFQQAINVHTAYLPSVDAGADHPEFDPPTEVDTAYGSTFNHNDIERLLWLTEEGEDLAYLVAQDAPGNYGLGSNDAIVVLVNDLTYGGGARTPLLTVSMESSAPQGLTHELGHAVIHLSDEYETEYTSEHKDAAEAQARTRVNVSGPVSNRSQLKWINLVDDSTAIPTQTRNPCDRINDCSSGPPASTLPPGTVGMYEGAGYVACGSYRPTTFCHMRCFVNTFCPVCEKAFRDVLGPFQPPTVDMYMRDNQLDTGAVPSPAGVEDPPGSGSRVKPWHSVDIRVDAPPFSNAAGLDVVHENPIAGVLNRVWVIPHNRGTAPAGEMASVTTYFAPATGGAPPFPGADWTSLGAVAGTIPGGFSFHMLINWNVPANLAGHTCLVATVSSPSDPLPALTGGLNNLVRNSNNITWKNMHIVTVPQIAGEISNFNQQVQSIVFRIEAPDVPVGTEFNLTHAEILSMSEFEPDDARQMDLLFLGESAFVFRRANASQEWFSLRVDLPAGEEKEPFRADFLLKVQFPGGTPPGESYVIDISQIAVDAQTGLLGGIIGGNQYTVGF